MSLLRNFSPDGSEPDDDEQLTTAARPDEVAPADEVAPPGSQASGTARYAFARSAGPAPATVVPSEVVTEPGGPVEQDDLAEETGPTPLAGAPSPETVAPDVAAPAAEKTLSPAFEAPSAEAIAPETVPVPLQTTPVPVPSPRAADEGEPDVQPAAGPMPDFAKPLLGDTAQLRARWQRVQGDFVDDPQAAVSSAADLVGHTVETLMEALRQRQRQLRAVWERDGVATASSAPDTEQLRLMMQRYRALFNELCRPS